MARLWVMHPDVHKEYMLGKVHFMKMGTTEQAEYINSIKNVDGNYNSCLSMDSIYKSPDAVRVTAKNGEICGLDKEQLGIIEKGLGADFVQKISSLFTNEPDLEEMLYVVKDGEAHIPVTGVLRRGRVVDSTYYKWGYSSTYNEIIVASQLADLDRRVTGDIVYDFNTPGGDVDGVDMAGMAIAATKKNTRGDIHFWCMSGGLWLLSQCNKAVALSETVQAGSLGVAYEWYDWSKWESDVGIELKTITSKNAPDKRPNAERLDELLQQDADDLEDIFVKRVATGRGQDPDHVRANYGQGWDLIASKALAAGMIDSIDGVTDNENLTSTEGAEAMDVSTLKDKHLSVYNQVIEEGSEKGVVIGEANERARVASHMSWMGKAKKDTVIANITEGKPCDNECMVAYSEEHAAAVVAGTRNKDDDGHEETSTEEPGAEGGAGAGQIDSKKLEQSLNKFGKIRN